MPKFLTDEEYNRRLLIYKQWKRKSTRRKAIQNINTLMGKKFTNFKQVHYWYCQFNKGNIDLVDLSYGFQIDIVEENYGLQIYSDNTQINGKSREKFNENYDNLVGSFLHLTETNRCPSDDEKLIANNGRFLIFSQFDKGELFITIYDLFRGTKRTSPVSNGTPSFVFTQFGQYLLLTKRCYFDQTCEFSAIRIDYENLTFKELNTVDIDFYYRSILADQVYGENFMFCFWDNFIIGRIQNDEIILDDIKNFGQGINWKYKRLIGNLVQGFHTNFDGSMRFCELNLDTMEKTEIDVPIKLYNEKVNSWDKHGHNFCWAKDQFYAFYRTGRSKNRLLSFDTIILKWFDVGIWTHSPQNLHVDENDVLTLKVGKYNGYNAYYRVALRKPETLMNLTMLKAVKESKFWDNGKYLNAMNSLPIEL